MADSILTNLQKRVLELLFERNFLKEEGYFLTGATALSEFDFHHQLSNDLDLFTRQDIDVRESSQQLLAIFQEQGWRVTNLEQRSPDFVRLVLLDPESGEQVHIDLCKDLQPIEPLRFAKNVIHDSVRDMAGRKMAAFLDRGDQEVKDAVDIYFLLTEGNFGLPDLIELGRAKSMDFEDPDVLLYLGGLLVQCGEEGYLARMRHLLYPPGKKPDFEQIGRRLRDEGQRLLNSLRPKE